jgi:hypothetical protein
MLIVCMKEGVDSLVILFFIVLKAENAYQYHTIQSCSTIKILKYAWLSYMILECTVEKYSFQQALTFFGWGDSFVSTTTH